jgi:hypothetical protein
MKLIFSALALLFFLPSALSAQNRQEGFEKDRTEVRGIIYPNWEKVIDSKHPAYNEVSIIDDPAGARSGNSYLQLRTHGGETAFQEYLRDASQVIPGQVYFVSAYARMVGTQPGERLRTNMATVQLRWLGKRGGPLRIDRSIPIMGATKWAPVSLEVQNPPQGAEWVQIRLSYGGRDVRGKCFFDDVHLQIKPRIIILPKNRTLPVFHPGESPDFQIRIPSLKSTSGILDITVRNQKGIVTLPTESISVQPRKEITHKLPRLRNSYNEMHLVLRDGGKILTQKVVPILTPEKAVFGSDTGEAMGLNFNPFHERYVGIRELASLLHLRQAKIVLWDQPAAQRSDEPSPGEILQLIRDAAQESGTNFIGVLAQPLPSAFPKQPSGEIQGSPLNLFFQKESIWESALQDTTRRYREVLRQWQIGIEEDPTASEITGRDISLGKAKDVIRKIQKNSIIGTPLSRNELKNTPLSHAQFYSVSTREWIRPEEYEVTPDPLDVIQYRTAQVKPAEPMEGTSARRDQAADFLQKMIFNAAAGNPYTLFLPATMSPQGGIIDSDGFPTATALAMRVVNDLLSGATLQKNQHLFVPPIRDFVFEKNGKWFVALWSNRGSQTIQTFLGHKAQLWDPLGTRAPFGSPGKTQVDHLPLFITDLDPYLLKTILTLQFHPEDVGQPPDATLPMVTDPIVKRLQFTNHYPTDLVGVRIRINQPLPDGWDLRPLEIQAPRLSKETTFSSPLSFRLPQTERAGQRKLRITLTFFRSDDQDRPFRITTERALLVTPQIFIKETIAPVGRNPNRKRVIIRIENRSGRHVNLRGVLRVPGRPDRPLLIGDFRDESARELDPIEVSVPPGSKARAIEIQLYEMGGKRTFINKTIRLGS